MGFIICVCACMYMQAPGPTWKRGEHFVLLVLSFLLYMASGDESQQVTGSESKHLYLLSTSTALFCYFVLCFETRSDAIALAALIHSVILSVSQHCAQERNHYFE